MNRRRAGRNTAVFFFALVLSGCPDPQGDFDSYIERTNGVRGVVPDGGMVADTGGDPGDAATDGPGFDSAGDITGNFLVSCLPALLAGDASKSLLFYAEVTKTGAALSFNSYPLSETATKFAKSSTVGVPQVITMVPVAADTTWHATVGTVSIPGTSQRIGESDLILENVKYDGRIVSSDRFCAELSGQLTSPFASSFDEPGDICVFVRLAEGEDLPTVKVDMTTTYVGFSAAEHHCP